MRSAVAPARAKARSRFWILRAGAAIWSFSDRWEFLLRFVKFLRFDVDLGCHQVNSHQFPLSYTSAVSIPAPRKVCSRWNSKLSENELTDLKLVWKNMVEILLKSAVCQNAICPGGVLLSEVASSPLQVIRRLRVGAALRGFKTALRELERSENHKFHDFDGFVTLRLS